MSPGTAAKARRKWAAAAGLVTVLTAAGCGDGGGSEQVANPRDPVRAMLRDRAEALNAGDVEGWLAPVAPEARAFEEQVARGALAAPLARVDLTLAGANVDQQGSRFKDAEVTVVHRYEGLPEDNVFRLDLLVDLELRDGSWVVTATRTSGLPPIWATGPVEVARTPHFLALFRPGAPGVAALLETAERGRARLVPRLTLVPDEQHLVVLARDDAEYEAFGGSAGSVALTSVLLRTPSGGFLDRPENRAMYVNLAALEDPAAVASVRDRPDALHGVVVEHELAHLALSRFDRSQTPAWLSEAGAMHLAEERRVEDWRRILDGDLFDDEGLSFGEMTRANRIGGVQYAYANAGASYLVEQFGVDTFWDFYQNFKALGATYSDVPDIRAQGAERLVRRYYGFGLEELDARTREWMRAAVATGG